MHSTHLLAMCGIAASTVALEWPTNFTPGSLLDSNFTNCPSTACNYFKQNYPNMTLLPEDAGYTAENEGE